MLARRSIIAYSFSSPSTRRNHQRFLLETIKCMHRCQFLGNQRLSLKKKNMAIRNEVDAVPVLPSDPGSWKVLIVGMLLTVVLPFWRNKWLSSVKLQDRVESVVEAAEHATDIVEKVAEEVEKVANEVADHLPEGGKLKEAVTFVENIAKETAKDAHLAHEVIGKVEEAEKEAEALVHTVIDQANEIRNEANNRPRLGKENQHI